MKITQVLIVILIGFSACYAPAKHHQVHPMVDGRNLEWEHLEKEVINLPNEVNLYIFQNESYVWIAYDFPEGSYGTLDIIIETEKIKEPLNLHVSAQLGEWKVGDEAKIPKVPDSDLWWNNQGWTANNLWANGIDTVTYSTPELNIKNGDLREIQLSKTRFGTGNWNIKMKINAIKTAEGNFTNISFPENGEYYSFFVN